MRIPIPECWIYQFRQEKHHVSLSQLAAGNINLGTRMGSVKSAHRRAGKVSFYLEVMKSLYSVLFFLEFLKNNAICFSTKVKNITFDIFEIENKIFQGYRRMSFFEEKLFI